MSVEAGNDAPFIYSGRTGNYGALVMVPLVHAVVIY